MALIRLNNILRHLFLIGLGLLAALTTACNSSSATNNDAAEPAPVVREDPPFPSLAWSARESSNFARVLEAPIEQVSNPAFQQRFMSQSAANLQSYTQRFLADPSWGLAALGGQSLLDALNPVALTQTIAQISSDPSAALALSFNTPLTPLCGLYMGPCTGDPFRYPGADTFYETEGDVIPVVFYDRDCTRLSGHVWAPRHAEPGKRLPAIVISTGSIQAPQTVHWWAAQALVRAGYVVLTYDVRGQGRSDFTSPSGQPGSDLEPTVFYREMVDAIDFLQSSESTPYPYTQSCSASYPTQVAAFNPHWALTDGQRMGLAGHSTGGYSVAVVQSFGASADQPWPGQLSATNPVKAIVAWDGMIDPQGEFGAYGQLEHLDVPLFRDLFGLLSSQLAGGSPPVTPRVPAMMQFSDYGAAPVPYLSPPPADAYLRGLKAWQDADLPAFAFTILGSSHYEWSPLPLFPSTSWCPQTNNGRCEGGWGLPMAEYYTVAWFDRWLKHSDEAGYADADARLLDNALFGERFSYHFESGYSFPDRDGQMRNCASINDACD